MKTISLLKAIITLSAITVGLSSCNTVRGVGRDVQRVGAGVERAVP